MGFHALRILLLCTLLTLSNAWAGGRLTLVLSERGGAYDDFASPFITALNRSGWSVNTITPAGLGQAPAADLVVAVGASALRAVLADGDRTPVLAALVTRAAYQQIVAAAPRGSGRSSALFLDQPAWRQAEFIRQLLPEATRVGMLTRLAGRDELVEFRQALTQRKFQLEVEESESDVSLIPALSALLPRVNVVLATPDPVIYRRDNIKPILITTLRHQRPMIAFSQALVGAGALAAIYTSPGQAGDEAAALVIAHGTSLPPPRTGLSFSLSINRTVAESLGIALPDDAALRRVLQTKRE